MLFVPYLTLGWGTRIFFCTAKAASTQKDAQFLRKKCFAVPAKFDEPWISETVIILLSWSYLRITRLHSPEQSPEERPGLKVLMIHKRFCIINSRKTLKSLPRAIWPEPSSPPICSFVSPRGGTQPCGSRVVNVARAWQWIRHELLTWNFLTNWSFFSPSWQCRESFIYR